MNLVEEWGALFNFFPNVRLFFFFLTIVNWVSLLLPPLLLFYLLPSTSYPPLWYFHPPSLPSVLCHMCNSLCHICHWKGLVNFRNLVYLVALWLSDVPPNVMTFLFISPDFSHCLGSDVLWGFLHAKWKRKRPSFFHFFNPLEFAFWHNPLRKSAFLKIFMGLILVQLSALLQ